MQHRSCLPQEETMTTKKSKYWLVYVDRSMTKTGSGVGELLLDPKGNKWQYEFSFGFQTSNNAIEYKALVSGLQLARQHGVRELVVHTNSQLVVKQLNGDYEIKELGLKKYHSIATQLLTGFDKEQVKQIPRSDSTQADALSKLASSIVIEQRGKILLEHREAPSYDTLQVYDIDQEDQWMTPIVHILQGTNDYLDKKDLTKVKCKAARYTLLECVLYKKGFSQQLLRCLTPSETEYVIKAFVANNRVEDCSPKKSLGRDITSP
ncbi:protein NYNRIN-like [Gossypium australe]|uniref:Protein NYNRIN-like n=1 Tax=Gossypium australe TaxID=47621 RepID=A0A5B6UVD3_9ROSI|nr:protein NYNRIN-like [Gossypium australe]